MATVVQSSDEQSLGIDDGSGEEKKRDEGGDAGPYIGGLGLCRELGLEEIEWRGKAPCSAWSPVERMGMTGGVKWSEGEGLLTSRARTSAGGGEGRVPIR
jgi:hypothetical protein